MNTLARRFAVSLSATFLALVVGQPAVASFSDATPDDNASLKPRLVGLVATHDAATIAGWLAPGWFGFGFEVVAVSTDISAKHTAPVFSLPTKTGSYFEQLPNAQVSPPPGQNPPPAAFNCVYQFGEEHLPRTDDGNDRGITEEYASIFGINYDRLDNVFSDLGAPSVWHPQADVSVSVNNPYLGSPYNELQLRPEFPSGRHHLSWSAETKFNPITDVTLPLTLAAFFSAAEGYLAKKIALIGPAGSASLRKAKFVLEALDIASELGIIVADVADTGEAMQWYRDTSVVGAVNRASQEFVVWDVHTPFFIPSQYLPISPSSGAYRIEEQVVEVEARDFGGIKFDRAYDDLRGRFAPVDNCGRGFNVGTDTTRSTLLTIGNENIIEWYADEIDGGPYHDQQPLAANQTLTDGQIRTVLTQRISVVDTQAPILLPPPGFARYEESGIDLTAEVFPLGRPRVVDLADPSPTVTNDAPAFLPGPPDGADGVRYSISWDAADDSGNAASVFAPPGSLVQTITLKRPGTNTPPTAEPAPPAVQAITAKTVDIWLQGTDTDMIDGRVDPLEFHIDSPPGRGQLEAPDYPYFIEDFRLTPVGEREEGDNLTRVSPLLHLADRFRLALHKPTVPPDGSDVRGTVLNQEICENPTPESEAAFGGVIPVNFVYRPGYVHVDDDGNFFIRDAFFHCDVKNLIGSNEDIPSSGELRVIPRLSKWSPEGDLLDMLVLMPVNLPGYDEVDCLDRSVYPSYEAAHPFNDFTVDHTGRFWMGFFLDTNVIVGAGFPVTHCSIAPDLDTLTYHGSSTTAGTTWNTSTLSGPVVGDLNADVIYQASPGNGVIVRRSGVQVNLWSLAPEDLIGILDLEALDSWAFRDIKVDSTGNVFVLETDGNRIHKYLPSKKTGPDSWELGAYVGWLGSCTTNKVDQATGVPYSRCDEASGTSKGFACTDRTCNRAADSSGNGESQFNLPASIEIAPGDILYVADTENSRVQRFSAEGTFAGQANATGTGVNQGDEPGFILGNMGKPKQLSANSSAFFVMEPDAADGDEFVHAFKTLPFHDVTDSSALVKYRSDFRFQGTDSFSYTVDDGIDQSAPTSVAITVSRDFNAPENLAWQCFAPGDLQNEVACRLAEDGGLYIRLSAEDKDGFFSDFPNGLDEHTFTITTPPQSGSLELDDPALEVDNATTLLYTPEPNFNGTDTFVFTAADAYSASSEQAEVALTIDPVPDPVVIEADENVMAARGFVRIFSADYSDADDDPAYEPGAIAIRWGDDVVAQGSSWTNSGNYDTNEREISPQVDLVVNQGMLVGSHRYDNVGSYSMQFEMVNPAGETDLPNTVSTTAVEVIEATVVAADLASPQSPVGPVTPFAVEFDITNLEPDGWAGLAAGNVRVSIDVPEGMQIVSVDARCANATPIECDLGDLAPGAVSSIVLAASIPLAEARDRQNYIFTLETFDDGPNFVDRNQQIATVSIADTDSDGVIDHDDAFADNPDYSADTDGDGLADRWEVDNGFDPLVADDTAADTDGDGFTLFEEFVNGSFPRLAEGEVAVAGAALAINDARDDRFGLFVAGGDLNQDGYADAVIGAPTASARGNVYIQYGAAGGAVDGFEEVAPAGSITNYGRSIAVGDWDDNGFPDLAVGHGNGVYIHYNNGRVLDLHDRSLSDPSSANFGAALLSADLDGDGLDDLIATAPQSIGSLVYLWLSGQGGLDGTPLIIADFAETMGVSVAVGDIDGDTVGDLLLGSPGGSSDDVFVYLGRDNDWTQAGLAAQRSFTMLAPDANAPFGFRVVSGADVGGDGVDDVVVGAYRTAGAVHLYDSEDNWIPALGESVAVAPSQTIIGLDDGSQPGDSYGDQFGVAMALGHLDSDDYADLVVGGNRAGVADEGQVRLFRGGPGGFTGNEQVVPGSVIYDMLGYGVAIAGDIDGDGFNDVVAGAPDIVANGRPQPDGGHVQILYHAFTAVNPADDPDADGVATAVDNCPATPNTNQSDIDDDGAGDACDGDIDGDGTTNELDNCPLVASTDLTDLDGDGQGDVCDDDDDGDGYADIDDAFPRDDRYSADSDSDGMPDAYETAYGLDPNDPADASADLDGDGRNNLAEFEQGSDVSVDDIAPDLAAPADILVNSTGPYTPVSLGAATAVDGKDGTLSASADNTGPFAPGDHSITWSAVDAAGNAATAIQRVQVVPMVNFNGTMVDAAEGQPLQVTLSLNGDAVDYPVTVPYTISGTATADDDYTALSGEVQVTQRELFILETAIVADGTADDGETIILTLGQPTNATAGANNVFTISIREGNLRPSVALDVLQGSQRVSTMTRDGGLVDLFARAEDPNGTGNFSYDWSATDPAILQAATQAGDQVTFDPAVLAAGTYRVSVTVTDDGNPALSATRHRIVRVIASAPTLSAASDADGDGVPDDVEGLADNNDNGASDYLDPSQVPHQLPSGTGMHGLLQVANGQGLRLGRAAMASGDDATVTMAEVILYGDDGAAAPDADDSRFRYPGGIFDFEITDVPEHGASVLVVLPQSAPVPADAGYRKYTTAGRWQDFVSDANNALMSAPGEPGVCPAPGHSSYTAGLTAGHYCVQLLIEDGGPNDADGAANGAIRDPGGVSMEDVAVAATASRDAVANTTVNAGAADVVLMRFSISVNSPDVEVSSVDLDASGSGNDGIDISAVKVWADANADGSVDSGDTLLGSGSYSSDNAVLNLQFDTPYLMPMGETRFIVSYDF